MIEITTSLPDAVDLHWETNGHASWLEDDDGIQYLPPKWIYRLVDEARAEGRNTIRQQIRDALTLEEARVTSPSMAKR
jgi:hypothetical protein